MRLEYQQLLKDYPDLAAQLDTFPGRVFTGKEHPSKGTRAVFFCYRLLRADHSVPNPEEELPWTEEAGETKWYLYDLGNDKIVDEPADIVEVIRSAPNTPRRCEIERKTLSEMRVKLEKHIKNTYLKKVQAPINVKPVLKAWMELN